MYTITTATIDDVQTIRQLAEATWWPTYKGIVSDAQIRYMLDELYSEEMLSRQMATNEQTYLILSEETQPVAFVGYSVYNAAPAAYKLHKLYCLPQTQGKGYGKILINEVAETAAADGAKNFYLNVNRCNRALFFYQKMGFTIDHEVDIPFGPFVLNDYVMVKGLG